MSQAEAAKKSLRAELDWRKSAASLEFDEPDADVARRHLLEFIRYGHPNYQAGWFHRELCAKLEWFSRECAAGRSPRLLIAAPPRHGKSEIVSRRWPVWHLGRHPEHEIVVASYGQELANDMSRDARAIRNDCLEWWPHLAPADKDGVEYWRTKGGGSYKAVGAGGPLTGRGAHCLVIDDPFKNSEEADSKTIRDARWAWYRNTAYTRLSPGGGVLVMATRWHHDDMSGRLLKQLADGEEDWVVVSYPAVAEADEEYREKGEALHPERYDLTSLDRIRVVLGSRAWLALYQQRPTSEAGGLFQRAWMRQRYRHDPQRPPKPYDEIVITVDATFKKSAKSDRVSMHAVGRYGWTVIHILDERCDRMSYTETRSVLRDLSIKWRPDVVLVEEKANGAALLDDLKEEIANLVPFIPDKYGDKVSRASLSTPTWEAGCISLPHGAQWVGDFVEEHADFPLGTFDDRVDDISQLILYWSERRRRGDSGTLARAIAGMLGPGV